MPPSEIRHNRNTYMMKKCNCDVCREAVRLYSEQRRRAKGVAPAQYSRYSASEIVELYAPTSSTECAKRIGRSATSVRLARRRAGIRRGPSPQRKPKETPQ